MALATASQSCGMGDGERRPDPGPDPSWNRFHRIPRIWAAAVLALVIGLILLGSFGHTGGSHVRTANSTAMKANGLVGDHALYSEIARRVGEGEPYYQAATAEQRENSYPTKPFLTVRLPTHAYIVAALGENAVKWIGMALGALVILLWRCRLVQARDLPGYARFAALIMAPNVIQPLASRPWVYMHESITGTLIALALVLYRPNRPWAAMAVMAITVLIRETALPVAILFGIFALWDRDWRAVGGWLLLGFGFLTVLALHIGAINAAILPTDLSSPGWNSSGGWLGYTSFLYKTSIFRYFPGWVTAIIVPLALLGWAAWNARLGFIGFCIQAFYAIFFVALARPDNFYWAVLIVPTLFIGLIFAPAALWALLQSVHRGRTPKAQLELAP